MTRIMHAASDLFRGQLSKTSRILVVLATLAILPSTVLPTWEITLHAPQYPDGLTLEIYPNTVAGDLQEVNLLNHYIGMHEIEPDAFPEFRFIPFFILRFFAFAVLAALAGWMAVAALGWIDFALFGVVMLNTLQHFLYQYGHDLDPAAPITLEPFTPNFLGSTTVGNFQVTSMPGIGATLMAVAALIGPVVLLIEWRRLVREGDGEPPDSGTPDPAGAG